MREIEKRLFAETYDRNLEKIMDYIGQDADINAKWEANGGFFTDDNTPYFRSMIWSRLLAYIIAFKLLLVRATPTYTNSLFMDNPMDCITMVIGGFLITKKCEKL